MKTIERIKLLIGEKAKSEREFANIIGVNQVTLNNYTSEKRKLSLEIIESILNAFPEISAEWLLRGTGSMILDEQSVSADETFYKKIIDDQHDLIQMLKQKINVQERSKDVETKAV